jgi:hypothetical protein
MTQRDRINAAMQAARAHQWQTATHPMPSMRAPADLGRTTKAVRGRHATAWARATNDQKSHAAMPPLHRDDVSVSSPRSRTPRSV